MSHPYSIPIGRIAYFGVPLNSPLEERARGVVLKENLKFSTLLLLLIQLYLHHSIPRSIGAMSSPFPSSSKSDLLDTQTAYMAHLYSLFESYCNFQHPDAPSQSQPPANVEMKPLGLVKNVIECRLCGDIYQTPAQLAQHSCPKMTPTAFHCRDCQKAFSCPANLASHQRWHRPKSASFFPKKTHQRQQSSQQQQQHQQQQQQNRVGQHPQGGEMGKSTPSTPRKPSTSASTSRSTRLYQRNDIRRRASFSIESILRPDHKKRETYSCFRCEEQLSSQSDFEDHIIDHLLCSR